MKYLTIASLIALFTAKAQSTFAPPADHPSGDHQARNDEDCDSDDEGRPGRGQNYVQGWRNIVHGRRNNVVGEENQAFGYENFLF